MTTVALLGVPWDGSSTFERGAAAAPPLIRQALWSPSSNGWNERGDDLSADGVLVDAGDLVLAGDAADVRATVEQAVRDILGQGGRPLILGGDHSITYPILRACGARRAHDDGRPTGSGPSDRLTVLHLDAHADLYDTFDDDRYTHASPFARVMEERLAGRLIQVGIRTMNGHQRSQASRFGVEVLGADRWREVLALLARLRGPVYVSLDLDVLEPALAPGISHPEPGGLTVREVLEILGSIRVPVVGADIVEFNPAHDVRDLTARVAAKFVKELVGLLRRSVAA
jgi:agmatinase